MSRSESTVGAVFDVQRTAIRQGEQAFKQGLTAQRSANRMALAGLQGQESLQRQGLELAHAATNAYVEASMAMAGTGNVGEGRRNVDETFSRAKGIHAAFFDAMERELDRGVSLFDDLSEEYLEALSRQTEQLMESHRTVEDRSTRNVDEYARQLREQQERTREMQEELEAQFERLSDQGERFLDQQREQAAAFQERLEEEAERMQRELRSQAQAGRERPPEEGQQIEIEAAEAGEADQSDPGSEHQLELIDGLGPTFRERLSEAGIRSIGDLAGADPDAVGEAADVSRERAEDWIEQAGGQG